MANYPKQLDELSHSSDPLAFIKDNIHLCPLLTSLSHPFAPLAKLAALPPPTISSLPIRLHSSTISAITTSLAAGGVLSGSVAFGQTSWAVSSQGQSTFYGDNIYTVSCKELQFGGAGATYVKNDRRFVLSQSALPRPLPPPKWLVNPILNCFSVYQNEVFALYISSGLHLVRYQGAAPAAPVPLPKGILVGGTEVENGLAVVLSTENGFRTVICNPKDGSMSVSSPINVGGEVVGVGKCNPGILIKTNDQNMILLPNNDYPIQQIREISGPFIVFTPGYLGQVIRKADRVRIILHFPSGCSGFRRSLAFPANSAVIPCDTGFLVVSNGLWAVTPAGATQLATQSLGEKFYALHNAVLSIQDGNSKILKLA